MHIGAALRPRRSLILPAATVAAPLVYVVLRDAPSTPNGRPTAAHAVLFCGTVLTGYLVACLLVAAVGIIVGLPLVMLYGGTVAVGNAVGVEPALGWQFLVVGLGIALSVLWTFTLSALTV